MLENMRPEDQKAAVEQGVSAFPHQSPQLWKDD
jgi:hypothetical protein